MANTNRSADWRVLCDLASKEKDSEKLIELITKINKALELCQQNPRDHVQANASSDSIGPELSPPGESDR
jgi:hypothetical protein